MYGLQIKLLRFFTITTGLRPIAVFMAVKGNTVPVSYTHLDVYKRQERESLFFQVIRHRYEKNSLIITTNLPMGRWDELFTGKLAATAILDRLVHHCHILSITGDSYRVKGSKQSVK